MVSVAEAENTPLPLPLSTQPSQLKSSSERVLGGQTPLGSHQNIPLKSSSSSRFGSTDAASAPSKLPSAPINHQQNSSAPMQNQSTQQKTSKKIVNDYYQWPVFMAILPPLLTLYYGGRVEEWSEAFLLIVVGCYLYGLIKLPWELYVAAHWASLRNQQQSANRVSVAYAAEHQQNEQPANKASSAPEKIRQASAFRLWFLEKFYFALVFASPLGGALFLRYIRPHLHVHQNLINEFPMALYVLTAYIRPLVYLSRLLKGQISALAAEIEYPVSEVAQLKQRIQDLDKQLAQLSVFCHDTREEVQSQVTQIFEHKFDPQLRDINKDLRKTTKFERRFAEYADERIRGLEERLQEQNEWIEANRTMLDQFSGNYEQRQRILLRPFYWMIDSVPSVSVSSFVLMPVHVAGVMLTWLLPGPVKRALLPAPPTTPTRSSITIMPPLPSPQIDNRLTEPRRSGSADISREQINDFDERKSDPLPNEYSRRKSVK